MLPDVPKQLDPQLLSQWHEDYSKRLKAFLVGLLRNQTLTDEALQSTFAKALTDGGSVQPGSERAWLFQVAFNEAMMLKRRAGINRQALNKLFEQGHARADSATATERIVEKETVEAIKQALSRLAANQREVVELRIYQQMTFQEIADELGIPLGTALTRMRSALGNLRVALSEYDQTE